MLFQILSSSLSLMDKIMMVLFRVVSVVIVISFHEFAHAFTSHIMGDDTAKNAGRMSLNPLKHLNPIGFILLLLFGFGWASPVIINPRNFKRPRLGFFLTALAGPLMNFIIGFLGVFLAILTLVISQSMPAQNISTFFSTLAIVSIGLGVFNLIPIPPLDGSKIIGELLPDRIRFKYYSLEKYSYIIFMALIAALYFFNFTSVIITSIINFFESIVFLIMF